MIGAAIGSAVGGIMGASAAGDANDQAQADSAAAAVARQESIDTVKGNQANVDELQAFLTESGAQGIEYAQGLMDSWENSFGGVKDNLTDYYNNLDPAKFATSSKATFMASMDKQMKQYDETMASSGMQSAGMKAQTAKEAAFKTAEGNASIDINAPEQVAQMQQGFVNSGETERRDAQNTMTNNMNNNVAYGQEGFRAQTNQNASVANAQSGEAAGYDASAERNAQSAAGYAGASGTMFGSAMNLGIKAMDK